MRWRNNKVPYKEVVIKRFAFFPIRLNQETRWLEYVKIKGYYWKPKHSLCTYFEDWYFKPECFVD